MMSKHELMDFVRFVSVELKVEEVSRLLDTKAYGGDPYSFYSGGKVSTADLDRSLREHTAVVIRKFLLLLAEWVECSESNRVVDPCDNCKNQGGRCPYVPNHRCDYGGNRLVTTSDVKRYVTALCADRPADEPQVQSGPVIAGVDRAQRESLEREVGWWEE